MAEHFAKSCTTARRYIVDSFDRDRQLYHQSGRPGDLCISATCRITGHVEHLVMKPDSKMLSVKATV